MSIYRSLRIVGLRDETPDCRSFFLDPVDGQPLPFKAGQFLTFAFFNAGGEQRRSYSIVSRPGQQGPLMITVKRIPNGEFSRFLFEKTRPGEDLLCTGAAGFFVLPAQAAEVQQYFFFAAGTGITPVLPLIETLLTEQPTCRLVLIYSNRSINTALFINRLEALKQQYTDRLRIEYLFSTDKDLARARLNKTRIVEILKDDRKLTIPDTQFYICGPFDYMRMVQIALLEHGVQRNQLHMEDFDPVVPNAVQEPPDKDSHLITINIDQQAFQFRARYPDTILQAAKRNHIVLPYSCEAGRCGSCAAICTSGTVWMRYNEVLVDEEINRGKVLTCTGFATGGDVQLSFDKL